MVSMDLGKFFYSITLTDLKNPSFHHILTSGSSTQNLWLELTESQRCAREMWHLNCDKNLVMRITCAISIPSPSPYQCWVLFFNFSWEELVRSGAMSINAFVLSNGKKTRGHFSWQIEEAVQGYVGKQGIFRAPLPCAPPWQQRKSSWVGLSLITSQILQLAIHV